MEQAITLPAIGAEFQGGIFAGITLHDDKATALVLLPGEATDVIWKDAQAMALVKKIPVNWLTEHDGQWRATMKDLEATSVDLNRAICEGVAEMQAAKADKP